MSIDAEGTGVRPAPEAAGDILDTPEAGRRVLRGGVLRVGGFVLGIGTSVLGAALVTRHLGPAAYGRFQTVVALVTIVSSVTDMGMSTLALREYAQRDGADRRGFMQTLLGMRLVLTAVGVLVALGVATALGYDNEMIAGTVLMGIGAAVAVVTSTFGTPLSAELRMGWVSGLDLGRQVITTIIYVALVVVSAGITPFLAVTIPVNLVLLAITIPLVRGRLDPRPTFDPRRWVELLRPTIVFSLATAVGTIYTYIALVLCELVANDEQTGLFAASFRVYVIVAAVPGILVTTAFPLLSRAARDDPDRLRYATQRLFEGTAILGGAALVGCVLGAVPIIDVIAGSAFRGAVPVLRIQGTAVAMTFVIATWGFTLMALHRHAALVVANAIALAVSTTTVLLLAGRHGATGAAFGTLLGELSLGAGYLLGLARHDARLKPRLSRVARAAAMVVLALGAALLPLPPLAQVVVGLVVYGAGLLLVDALPDEVREHLPGPLRRVVLLRSPQT